MTSNICKLCKKPIREGEGRINIPVYNEEDENVGLDTYHFNCGLKVPKENEEMASA